MTDYDKYVEYFLDSLLEQYWETEEYSELEEEYFGFNLSYKNPIQKFLLFNFLTNEEFKTYFEGYCEEEWRKYVDEYENSDEYIEAQDIQSKVDAYLDEMRGLND